MFENPTHVQHAPKSKQSRGPGSIYRVIPDAFPVFSTVSTTLYPIGTSIADDPTNAVPQVLSRRAPATQPRDVVVLAKRARPTFSEAEFSK